MKRCLIKLCLWILAGAIVNVAVAWGCGAFVGPRSVMDAFSQARQFMCPHDKLTWTVLYWEMPGAIQLWVEATQLDDETYLRLDAREFQVPPGMPPAWSIASGSPAAVVGTDQAEAVEVARGWPMVSQVATYSFFYGPKGWTKQSLNGGIDLSKEDDNPANCLAWRALPCVPIWTGFAINTVFYAIIVWILWAAPLALRREFRRRRSLCMKCAYDLRGNTSGTCPECGEAISSYKPGADARV